MINKKYIFLIVSILIGISLIVIGVFLKREVSSRDIKPPDVITSIPNLSPEMQKICNDYLITLYPLMTKPTDNFWKTLDFFYFAAKLNSSEFVSNSNSAIGFPINRNVGNLPNTIFNIYRKLIAPTKYALINSYNQGPSTVVAQKFDIVSFPFTGDQRGPGGEKDVAGLFINRFDPNNLFNNKANIGFCATGTHQNEISSVKDVLNTSTYYIGQRGKDGEILGFISGKPIEIVHKFTHDSSNNEATLNTQFFDAMLNNYGDFLYYSRGSGIFFNPGNVLNVRNKIDAVRCCFDQSENLPQIPNIKNEGTHNKYYGKCKNNFTGYLNIVKILGTDKNLGKATVSEHDKPDFDYTGLPEASQNFQCKQSISDGGVWCHGNSILNQYSCCKGIVTSTEQCSDGGSFNVYPASQSRECVYVAGAPDTFFSWKALEPVVPDKMPNNTKLTTDELKLAWLLYVSCNGITSSSGNFKNPWKKNKKLTSDQTILLTQMVAFLANTGGMGDLVYQIPFEKTVLNEKGDRKYDTIIMAVQPEITGCFATEIFTLNYDGTPTKFSTRNPQQFSNAKVCNFTVNPGNQTTFQKKPCTGYKQCLHSSSNIQGMCINKKCEPPNLLTCDKISWATPQISYPVLPIGKTAAFDIRPQ